MFCLLLAHFGRFRLSIYFKNKVKNIIRVQLGLKIRNVNPCPSVSGHLTPRHAGTPTLFPKLFREQFFLVWILRAKCCSNLKGTRDAKCQNLHFSTKSDIIRLTHIIPEKPLVRKRVFIYKIPYLTLGFFTHIQFH